MSSQLVTAEKRLRVCLLLDAYGDLLTEKQRTFMKRYYEEDFSFGEIARESNVSRQAIFDAVKHGEATLEEYERVLGLVRSGRRADGPGDAGALAGAIGRLRELAERPPAAGHLPRELTAIADALENLTGGADGVPSGQPAARVRREKPAAALSSPSVPMFLRGGGPEVD